MSENGTTPEPTTVRTTTLDNGIRVISDPMDSVESVSLGAWIGVGTRHESPEINGVAHLLEHMVFKGTERRDAVAIAEEIEAVGGHMNAYTSREQTAYYAKMLKADLPLAVDMISDILQNSLFDDEELARERKVVLQEIGQANDTPDDVIFDFFQEAAFPDQTLGRPVLGRGEVVGEMPRQTVVDFISENYGGEQLVFSAAGNVDHEQLVDRVSERFSALKPSSAAKTDVSFYQGGEHREERDLEQLHLLLGFQGFAYHDPDFYAQQVFSVLFGGGMSSRLFQEVREKRGLVYSIYSFASAYHDNGLFGIYAGTGPEQAAELVPVVCDEICKASDGIRPEEIQRARTQLKSGLLMSREGTSNRCEQLAQHMLVHGRAIPVDELVAEVDAVDEAAIRRVVDRLRASVPTVAAVGPLEYLESRESIAKRLN